MTEQNEITSVSAHYTSNDLTTIILNALKTIGKNPDALTTEDLIAVDQLHTGGKTATLELAQLANVQADLAVLDVGGGIGGPARTLANAFKCHVTVLDLTDALCQTGEVLTKLTNLDKLVTFQQGSAFAMPFANETFDIAWTQHSSMNMSDKEKLYSEIYRVLRSGAKLALHEIMAGANSPVDYPQPWAQDASISFLRPPEEIRALLKSLGFKELIWRDTTSAAIAWFNERMAATQGATAPPPLGLHLVLGRNFSQMFQNAFRNLKENRLTIIEAVFQKS